MKVAIVTGAGSGIGRAVAIRLGQDGFKLVLAGRRLDKLLETERNIVSECISVATDVTGPASVAALFAKTKERFGRLDLLFNNAGSGVPGTIMLEDIDPEQWSKVVNTNLSGAFYCIQQAFLLMKTQSPIGGRVINNGSISAYVPRPNSAPYTATKHAITGLTKSASLDGRKYNIAVGQVDIGNASTDMTGQMEIGMPQADGTTAPEPVMDVDNVANTVSHMASLPLEANVQFVTVMATKMPFIGRG